MASKFTRLNLGVVDISFAPCIYNVVQKKCIYNELAHALAVFGACHEADRACWVNMVPNDVMCVSGKKICLANIVRKNRSKNLVTYFESCR
jgi:hypothetical protein